MLVQFHFHPITKKRIVKEKEGKQIQGEKQIIQEEKIIQGEKQIIQGEKQILVEGRILVEEQIQGKGRILKEKKERIIQEKNVSLLKKIHLIC